MYLLLVFVIEVAIEQTYVTMLGMVAA